MSRWWRAYDESVDDPKLLLLSDRAHRAWFNLLCLASIGGGSLPERKVIELKLRLSAAKTQAVIEELIQAELLDRDETGLTPHNWNGRQYKSDVSTERVQQHRERKRNVSVTPPETEADTETESKKESIGRSPKATRPKVSAEFEEFWKVYPRRLGANPKAPASKVFDAAVKQGADPAAIIAGARRCAVVDRDKIGTPYIPQAVKWLRDKRWEDYQPPATAGPPQAPAGAPSDEELRKKYGQPAAVHTETEAAGANGAGADHGTELRSTGAEIRPILRPF